jgi:iron complex transport system substrate-binding protein
MHRARTGIARISVTVLITVALAGLVAVLSGCGAPAASAPASPAKAAGFPVTITDDASRTVTVDAAPKRIVSLAPANTEIVYSLGILDRLVGVTTYDDYPSQVASIAKVGDFQTPNLEAIAAANPDLILVTGGVQADVLSKLEGLGANVVVIDPQTVDGVMSAIGKVAKITGTVSAGRNVVDGMNQKLASVRLALAGGARIPTFFEIGWNPLYTAGPGTLIDDVIRRAGGENVVTKPGYVGYSVEQLLKDKPEVYFGTQSSLGDATSLAKRPGYAQVLLAAGNRVYALPDDLVSRPGPRIVDGIELMAKALHPDLFK